MVRRVITAINKQGQSFITADAETPNVEVPLPDVLPGLTFYNCWTTAEMPVDYQLAGDPVEGAYVPVSPPTNGSMFRLVNFPSEIEFMESIQGMSPEQRAEFSDKLAINMDVEDVSRHPFMHQTDSIDYGIVISGSIYLMLDNEETLLHPGDVVIQRGTNHAWSNRSGKDCLMAFVLLDGNRP